MRKNESSKAIKARQRVLEEVIKIQMYIKKQAKTMSSIVTYTIDILVK